VLPERPRYRDLWEAAPALSAAQLRFERARRTWGLFLGPALFVLLLAFPPAAIPRGDAARLLAVAAWTLTWWITEAVPIPVTSLLAPSLAVLCGVGSPKELVAPFGEPIILLFLGSFLLAEAMLASGLDRRIAHAILSHHWVGSSATRLLLAFVASTAGLSMWLSNTATAAMMFPLGLAVLTALPRLLAEKNGAPVDLTRLRFGTALMLAIAYAASIGGTATPVGTPPNLIVLSSLESLTGVKISFFTWMVLTAPVTLAMLAVLVIYLRLALPPELAEIAGSRQLLAAERAALGRWRPAERNTLIAFLLAVTLWVTPGAAALLLGPSSGAASTLGALFPEAVVAVLAASLLFVLPVDWPARRFTLSWSNAARIDWGTLLLFGGGLSLGGAMLQTGLAKVLGTFLVEATGARSLTALTFLFGITAIFLTETTSNTAAAAMLAPIAIASAQAAGVSPVPPAVAIALGCSMAFMLPVATPPNAIVYGSGGVPIRAMVVHGLVLNLCSAALIPAGAVLLCRLLALS